MARDLAPLLPESVAVVFPSRRCAGKPSDGFPEHYTTTVSLGDVTLTDSDFTPEPLGVAGTTHTVRSTALALYSTATGDPTNKSALDALAAQVAQDFYDYRSFGLDVVYNGIIAPDLTALHDVVEFRYDGTDQTTRVQSQGWNGEPQELQHQDPAISGCQDSESTPRDDRTPGVLVDIPGGASGTSARGVLAIEDGRLVMTYDRAEALDCQCGCTGSICTTVKDCNNALATGATVTATKDGSSHTCTVADQVVSVTRTAGGSGYTSGTGYALGFSGGGGSGAAGLFDVVSGAATNLRLTAGGSGYTSAPTVSFPGAGSGSGAAATAAIASKCCISGLATGTYSVSATLGASTTTATVDVTGCAEFDVTITLNYRVCMTARTLCESFGADPVVFAVSQAGTPVGSVNLTPTTDTNFPGDTVAGCVGVPGPGTYNWSASHPNYLSARTGSVTVASGVCQANATATFGDPDALDRCCDCVGASLMCPPPGSTSKSLVISDGLGSATATNPNCGTGGWSVEVGRSGSPGSTACFPCNEVAGPIAGLSGISVTCGANGTVDVTVAVTSCLHTDFTGSKRLLCPDTSTTGHTFLSANGAVSSCYPLAGSVTITVPPDDDLSGGHYYGSFRAIYGDSITITFSEP